jgi:predicted esterase
MQVRAVQIVLIIVAATALGMMLRQSGKLMEPRIAAQASAIPNNAGTLPKYAKRDTVFSLGGREVELRYPKGVIRGSLLVLPGWDHSRSRWCNETQLCNQALAEGYVLILPEMHRSIYASQYFAETHADLRTEASLPWLTDTLFPLLQKRWQLLLPTGTNFLVGLSTGGRGVLQIALRTGKLFKAGAALSGDFDQTLQPNDNLMRLVYGPYEKFKSRWQTTDNPGLQASISLQTPLYLAHGKEDKVVPIFQTDSLYARLTRAGKTVEIGRNDTAGHTYGYWNSEVPHMLDFLRKYVVAEK